MWPVKTGLIDYDNFDEMSTFEHLLYWRFRKQTKLNLVSGRATHTNG